MQKLLEEMNEAKVEGNKLFGDGLYEEALLKYDYAIQLAPEISSLSEIRSICHNNRATCFFKLVSSNLLPYQLNSVVMCL